MGVGKAIGFGTVAFAGIVTVVVVSLVVFKSLWTWVMPDLFPGAIQQGLMVREISWWTAFKVALLVGVLRGSFQFKITQGGSS